MNAQQVVDAINAEFQGTPIKAEVLGGSWATVYWYTGASSRRIVAKMTVTRNHVKFEVPQGQPVVHSVRAAIRVIHLVMGA